MVFPQCLGSCELSQSVKGYRAQQVFPHQVLPSFVVGWTSWTEEPLYADWICRCWRHPYKYPYKHPYKFWWNGIYVIWKYKTVSCCDWHRWKERKGNDGGGRFEESSQFPWIFSYASHYWRLGKNEISELATSSSPEISSDRERVSGVWWVCQINVKNLPELAPRRRSAEEFQGCLVLSKNFFWSGNLMRFSENR